MATLQLRNLHKSFGGATVLHDVGLELEHGEFLVLVGPSGCGKSTLMNLIAGLEQPSGGQILLDGRDITWLAPAERNLSMVFQSYALYPNMTVARNIEFPLRMRKVPAAQRERRVRHVAAMLHIEHLLGRKPRQLSGGQRQRVAIGRALAREPHLYLFDEPLSNLDAQLRVEMRTEIKKLHQRLGATVVYVTHDQIEAMTLATRIVVMRDGRVQQVGTPGEVYHRPANTFVAGFMGSPRMNLLRVSLVRAGDTLRAMCGGQGEVQGAVQGDLPGFELPQPPAHPALWARAGGEVLLGLRAEAISLPGPGAMPQGAQRAIEVRIDLVEPTGADTLVVFTLAGQELTARLGADCTLRAGETTRLLLDLGNVVVFDPDSGQRIGA